MENAKPASWPRPHIDNKVNIVILEQCNKITCLVTRMTDCKNPIHFQSSNPDVSSSRARETPFRYWSLRRSQACRCHYIILMGYHVVRKCQQRSALPLLKCLAGLRPYLVYLLSITSTFAGERRSMAFTPSLSRSMSSPQAVHVCLLPLNRSLDTGQSPVNPSHAPGDAHIRESHGSAQPRNRAQLSRHGGSSAAKPGAPPSSRRGPVAST